MRQALAYLLMTPTGFRHRVYLSQLDAEADQRHHAARGEEWPIIPLCDASDVASLEADRQDGAEIVSVSETGRKVIDLMEALKASLAARSSQEEIR